MFKIGSVLPNGATVLGVAVHPLYDNEVVVLAQWQYDTFVTWLADANDPASTVHGHYLRSYAEAIADFAKRLNRK